MKINNGKCPFLRRRVKIVLDKTQKLWYNMLIESRVLYFIMEYVKDLWEPHTKEERKMYSQAYYDRHPKRNLVNNARKRAAVKDLPFNITESDIEIPEVCPYLKTPFQKNTMYAMSLDRIDPRLGYVKGNIEVISRKANVMKNDASVEELLEFAYTILERH